METRRAASIFGVVSTCLVLGAAASAGCGSNKATAPAEPLVSRITFTDQAPAAGSTIVPTGTPPGSFLVRNSGAISVGLTLVSAKEVPWAQLSVYLLTADGYCGQNTPDAPTWQFFGPGEPVNLKITGFQIYRLPCDVTGIRAMFHMRNNGLLIPPSPSETIVEATLPVNYHLRAAQ